MDFMCISRIFCWCQFEKCWKFWSLPEIVLTRNFGILWIQGNFRMRKFPKEMLDGLEWRNIYFFLFKIISFIAEQQFLFQKILLMLEKPNFLWLDFFISFMFFFYDFYDYLWFEMANLCCCFRQFIQRIGITFFTMAGTAFENFPPISQDNLRRCESMHGLGLRQPFEKSISQKLNLPTKKIFREP